MSLAEVGKRCDVTAATVQSWLVADGVRVRSRSESAKLRGAKRKAERERVVADILADHQVLPS